MTEQGPETKDTARPAAGKRAPRGNGTPPRAPKPPRPSNAEVDARVTLVLNLIVQGVCRRRAILQTLAKMYGDGKLDWRVKKAGEEYDPLESTAAVSTRTIDLYIQRATSELMRIADEPRSVAKSKARARYELALAGAASAKQWDVVRKVVRDMARLDGLEPGVRVNVGGSIDTNVSGSVEHTHALRSGSIEERANRMTDILNIANQRRAAGQVPAAKASEN